MVGINNYNRRKLEDLPLRFAERDVQELTVVLQEQKFIVRTMTGPDATKVNIEEALTGLLKGPKKEIVVVAFTGHGMQLPLKDEGGNLVRDAQGRELSDAFFCPFDAVAGEGSTMISLTRLVERLDNEGGTNLFLVDACRDDFDPHRGLGKRSLSGDELVGRLPGNSAILFSCSKGQQASSTSRRGGHGVFFHQVIEGLRGAAADAETGEVGWDDLVGYVRKCVNCLARELDPEGARKADERFSGNLQTPQEIRNLVATPILARHVQSRASPSCPGPPMFPSEASPGWTRSRPGPPASPSSGSPPARSRWARPMGQAMKTSIRNTRSGSPGRFRAAAESWPRLRMICRLRSEWPQPSWPRGRLTRLRSCTTACSRS